MRQTWRSQELETAMRRPLADWPEPSTSVKRAVVRPRDPATTDPDPQP